MAPSSGAQTVNVPTASMLPSFETPPFFPCRLNGRAHFDDPDEAAMHEALDHIETAHDESEEEEGEYKVSDTTGANNQSMISVKLLVIVITKSYLKFLYKSVI